MRTRAGGRTSRASPVAAASGDEQPSIRFASSPGTSVRTLPGPSEQAYRVRGLVGGRGSCDRHANGERVCCRCVLGIQADVGPTRGHGGFVVFPIDDDDSARRSTPVVTWILIAANVVVFLVE